MHKSKKKEAMEARLLKPSIGNNLRYDEEEEEAEAEAEAATKRLLNKSSMQLDFDAPLLSVRRNRAESAPSMPSHNSGVNRCGSSSNSSNSSLRRPPIPFFTWELPSSTSQAIVPAESIHPGELISGRSTGGLVLAPPPRLQRMKSRRKIEFSDARSEFALTEVPSVAPTYVVSNVAMEDDEEELEDDQGMEIAEYNAGDREMIMQRFLPAAKAVAAEMASRFDDQQPVIFHPSPQVHSNYQRKFAETPKQKFGELINMDQPESSGDEEDDDDENDDGGGGGGGGSQIVADSVCGFFPLLKMLQTSGCRNKAAQIRITQKTLKKEKPGSKEDGGDDPCSEEWQVDEDLQAQSQAYSACKYTPSRGGLKSSAIMESKGFLGMPRDRLGKTYVKRMYPVLEITGKKQQLQQQEDSDSDSSQSLSSIRLDELSAANSRQSSNGGEKIFCLDTLNQFRESAAAAAAVLKQKKLPIRGNGAEESFTVDVERVQYSSVSGQEGQILYSSRKKKKQQQQQTNLQQSGRMLVGSDDDDDQDDEVDDDGGDELSRELRLCWHDQEDKAVVLPTPRCPSQSWLEKRRAEVRSAAAQRKPPLVRIRASGF